MEAVGQDRPMSSEIHLGETVAASTRRLQAVVGSNTMQPRVTPTREDPTRVAKSLITWPVERTQRRKMQMLCSKLPLSSPQLTSLRVSDTK